jgi:hypothetical protein
VGGLLLLITSEQQKALVDEFPELSNADVILPKEVYAHFGLLFFKFSLVEHSLINILMFHHLGAELAAKRIRSREDSERECDRGYDRARQQTFGNLLKEVRAIAEFAPFADRLSKIKKHRDYFAHHFFRDEVGMYGNDEGCWHVLWAIQKVRDEVIALDRELDAPTMQMCKRLSVPQASDEVLDREKGRMLAEAQARLSSGNPFDGS